MPSSISLELAKRLRRRLEIQNEIDAIMEDPIALKDLIHDKVVRPSIDLNQLERASGMELRNRRNGHPVR